MSSLVGKKKKTDDSNVPFTPLFNKEIEERIQ
jgi:hypothetical protein